MKDEEEQEKRVRLFYLLFLFVWLDSSRQRGMHTSE
jgi:hypothetical protein